MAKENLKDKLDGNELDLSLSSLEAVPVKEIASVPKATHLDLSCNLLTKLPADFTSRLNYIIKLDLSKNQITVLPDNFGTLQQLQTLDLFSNKLQSLPVSFGYLKKLKWLDVKDNPLREPVASVAGDCLDDPQCRICAKNVVQYMRKVLSDSEREKQKRLKEEREKEAARKQAEERELQRKKAEKKREKEEKRRQYEAQQAARKQASSPRNDNHDNHTSRQSARTSKPKAQNRGGLSCCGVFIAFLLGLVAVGVGLYFYCDSHKSDTACRQLITWLQPYYNKSSKFAIYYGTIARDFIIKFGSQAADVSVTYLNATKAFLINCLQKLQETIESWSDSKS